MSTRNSLTYKPMINAGITIITIKFLMIVLSLAPIALSSVLFDLFMTNPPLAALLSNLFLFLPLLIGWIMDLMLIIFLFVMFTRMENDSPQDRERVKFPKIITLILAGLLGLYLIIYVVTYLEVFGFISLSITLLNILQIALIIFEILIGGLILSLFLMLDQILISQEKLREFTILRKFTKVFGIFWGLYHLFFGISFILDFFTLSNTVQSIFLSCVLLLGSITSLCAFAVGVGFIQMGRRLQNS
ncbi:MAG: hypothetical protein ACTSRE_01685 [Promethearchaeota archaeon]